MRSRQSEYRAARDEESEQEGMETPFGDDCLNTGVQWGVLCCMA